jgi:hypothetical protein
MNTNDNSQYPSWLEELEQAQLTDLDVVLSNLQTVNHTSTEIDSWMDAMQVFTDIPVPPASDLVPGPIWPVTDIMPATLASNTPAAIQFSSVVVKAALNESFLDYLKSLQADMLLLYFMDLANVTWNYMFNQPVARRVTKSVCNKIMMDTCE